MLIPYSFNVKKLVKDQILFDYIDYIENSDLGLIQVYR